MDDFAEAKHCLKKAYKIHPTPAESEKFVKVFNAGKKKIACCTLDIPTSFPL
jgi:hypothetical protein